MIFFYKSTDSHPYNTVAISILRSLVKNIVILQQYCRDDCRHLLFLTTMLTHYLQLYTSTTPQFSNKYCHLYDNLDVFVYCVRTPELNFSHYLQHWNQSKKGQKRRQASQIQTSSCRSSSTCSLTAARLQKHKSSVIKSCQHWALVSINI